MNYAYEWDLINNDVILIYKYNVYNMHVFLDVAVLCGIKTSWYRIFLQ